MIKILHTADVHLDSPLKSLALKDEELKATVQTATRTAFTRMIDFALDEGVSALLISGDLFDGAERSAKTAAFLTLQLDRLNAAGILVFYIKGNHDAENPITGDLDLPGNVHIFDGRGGRKQIPDTDVWIHGVSFNGRQAPESLLPKFGTPEPDAINIAMLHSSLAGSEGHDTYAPCSVAELNGMGFDYWALGHIHKRQVHSEAPWVVMPGIPQGRDIGESGPKSATLITIDGTGLQVSEVPTSAAEFLELSVSPGAEDGDDGLRQSLRGLFTSTAQNLSADAGLVRLTIAGKTSRSWQILRDQDIWRATASELARSTGKLWVEKLRFDLSSEEDASQSETSAVTELGRLMLDIQNEPAVAADFQETLQALLSEIPASSRARLIPSEAEAVDLTKTLAREGATALLAAMKGADQ